MMDYVFLFRSRENFVFDVDSKTYANALKLRDFEKILEYGLMCNYY